jgi:hypothetical protein
MDEDSSLNHGASTTTGGVASARTAHHDSSTGAATVAESSISESLSSMAPSTTDTYSSRKQRSRHPGWLEEQMAESDGESEDSETPAHEYQPGAFALAPGQEAESRQVKGQLTSMPQPERMPSVVRGEFDPVPAPVPPAGTHPGNTRGTPESRNDRDYKDLQKNRRGPMLLYLAVAFLVIAVGAGVGIGLSGSNEVEVEVEDEDEDPRPEELIARLSKFTTDDSAWDDPESPQQRAIQWLAQEDQQWRDDEDGGSNTRLETRYALAVLYFATNGPAWFYNPGFLNPMTHECTWNKFHQIDQGQDPLHPLALLSELPQPRCGFPLPSNSRGDLYADSLGDDAYGVICANYYSTDNELAGATNDTATNPSSPAVVAVLLGELTCGYPDCFFNPYQTNDRLTTHCSLFLVFSSLFRAKWTIGCIA